jgi:hypothetical protein
MIHQHHRLHIFNHLLLLLVLSKGTILFFEYFYLGICDYRFDEPKPKPKPTQPPPPPPPQTKTVVSSPLKTNISTGQLSAPNRKESKSPSPQRIKVISTIETKLVFI